MYDGGVRNLILGCTHFPLLKKAIADVYPDMDLIDTESKSPARCAPYWAKKP